MMSFDYILLTFVWIIGFILFVLFTPKQYKRKMILAALVFQSFAWLNALIHLELKLIAFPIREFPEASNILFATEYFLYPILYGLYIIHQPKKHFAIRFIFLLAVVSGLVAIELVFVHFSHLVVYINYAWYFEWVTFFIMFVLANYVYYWFDNENSLFKKKERILQ